MRPWPGASVAALLQQVLQELVDHALGLADRGAFRRALSASRVTARGDQVAFEARLPR
ncbi:MAG: hypothetical protein IPJ58_05770 [Ardenticatenia bacterium]|nr:hypothetical protein [Ardenticatenia bacterium]HRA21352.1 hypothetical protein [Anaerolineae bacterium]